MALRNSASNLEACARPPRAVAAVALSLLGLMTGCLNLSPGELEVVVNHVPVIVSVFPEPSFEPVQVNVGANCRPETFRLDDLDDSDLDTLTVRWHLLFNREGTPVRERVAAEILPALINPTTELRYAPVTLSLDRAVFNRELGQSGIRDQSASNVFQLLEVRVSDAGFADVEDDVATAPGAGLAFRSWQMKLLDNDCSVTP
jgi:hypothetical protein